MLSEDKRFNNPHNVLLIFGVAVLEFLEDSSLNETLFIESLLIPKNLESHNVLGLVVKALEHLAKGSLTNALLHLKSVSDMVMHITDVLSFVIVKSPILWSIRRG